MRAVIFNSGLRSTVDFPIPEPEEGEALIRIQMTGICNTDLEIIKGYQGFQGIIGHEFAGTVEKICGEDTSLVGKRVVGEINCGCGDCDYCLQGMGNHCPRRTVLGISGKNGAMADYITLPVRNLLEVPLSVPVEAAVFTEPLAAAFEIPEQVSVHASDRILVLGDGKLGILCALVIRLQGSDVTLAGKHDHKLELAAAQGVGTVLVSKLNPEEKFDLVIEATGNPGGFAAACAFVKPRGTIVLKSTTAAAGEISLTPVVVNEVTVVGSRCGPFRPALEALADRSVDVRPLISGIFPFEKAEHAFARAREKQSLKILIDFR